MVPQSIQHASPVRREKLKMNPIFWKVFKLRPKVVDK